MPPLFHHVQVAAIDGLGRLHLSSEPEYVLDTYDVSGRQIRQLRNESKRTRVTEGLIEEWIEAAERRPCGPVGRGNGCQDDIIGEALEQPIPEFLPVISRIGAWEEGWLAGLRRDLDPRPMESGDPAVWDLFDPSGAFVGRVEGRFNVMWYDGSFLIVVAYDEFDVESVVGYRISDQ